MYTLIQGPEARKHIEKAVQPRIAWEAAAK